MQQETKMGPVSYPIGCAAGIGTDIRLKYPHGIDSDQVASALALVDFSVLEGSVQVLDFSLQFHSWNPGAILAKELLVFSFRAAAAMASMIAYNHRNHKNSCLYSCH